MATATIFDDLVSTDRKGEGASTIFDDLVSTDRKGEGASTIFDDLGYTPEPEPNYLKVPLKETQYSKQGFISGYDDPIESYLPPKPPEGPRFRGAGASASWVEDQDRDIFEHPLKASAESIKEQYKSSAKLFKDNIGKAFGPPGPVPSKDEARVKALMGALGVIISPLAPAFGFAENLSRNGALTYLMTKEPEAYNAMIERGWVDPVKGIVNMENIGVLTGENRPTTGNPVIDIISDVGIGLIPIGGGAGVASRAGRVGRIADVTQDVRKAVGITDDIPRAIEAVTTAAKDTKSLFRTSAGTISEAPRPTIKPKTVFDDIKIEGPKRPRQEPSFAKPEVDISIAPKSKGTAGSYVSSRKPPEIPPDTTLPGRAGKRAKAKKAPEGSALAEAEKLTQVEIKKPELLARIKKTKTKIQSQLVSEFTPVRNLERDVMDVAGKPVPVTDMARKFEQVAGAKGMVEADVIQFKKVVVDPIRDIADDFNTFLFLRRTESRLKNNPKVKKVGDWTVEKSQTALKELEGKIGPENMARLDEAGKAFQVEMDKALRLQVESGRMTEEVYEKIKASNDFYARFKVMKYMEGVDTGAPGTGRNIANTQDLTKAITGIDEADLAIGNILQASAEQIARSRILAQKNLKMLELDKLIDIDKTGSLMSRARPTRYFKDDPDTAAEILSQLALQQTSHKPQLLEQSLVKVGQAIQYAEEVGLKVKRFRMPSALGRATLGGIKKLGGKVDLKAFTSDVIAHELGHAFDVTIGSKLKNVFGAVRDVDIRLSSAVNKRRVYQKELTAIQDYRGMGGSEKYKSKAVERFAEFIDQYIHDPKMAKKLAPNWTAHFEAEILPKQRIKELVEKLGKFFHKVDKLPNIMTPLTELDDANYLVTAIRKAFPKRSAPPRVIFGTKPKPGNEIVNYFKDGKETAMEVSKEAAKAIEGLTVAETTQMMKVMAAGKVPLQWGATSANAAFQVVNLLFADLSRAALISWYGLKGVKDLYKFPADWIYSFFTSIKGNFGKPNNLYMDFLKSGAANSTIQRSLTPSAFKVTLGLPEKLSAKGVASIPKKYVLDNVAKFGNAIEETSKVLGLKRGMRLEKISSMSPDDALEAMQKIVAEVRNYSGSPDFLRRGSQTQKLNLLFMFFNARVQGAVADITRLAGKTGKKEARSAWTRLGIGVGLPATFISILNHSGPFKEFYDTVPQWEKENYFILPVGVMTGQTFINRDGIAVPEYYRVPKREIVKIFGNFIDSAVEFVADANPKAFIRFALDFIENMSPVNIEGDTAQERLESVVSSTNPVLKAPVELATGRDTFRHYNVTPQYMERAESQEQYRETTSAPYVWAGNTELAKALGFSPIEIEQLTRGLTAGGISQFTNRKPQIGRSAVSVNPLTKRFFGSGSTEDREAEKILTAEEQKEANEQVRHRREALELMREWKEAGLSESEMNKKIAVLRKSDKRLAEKARDLATEYQKQITYHDKRIKQLGIKSGARANYIVQILRGLSGPKERDEYIKSLREKKILTKDVYAQARRSAPEMF